MTTPLSWVVCHPQTGLVMVTLYTKYEVSDSTCCDHRKGDAKCRKQGNL